LSDNDLSAWILLAQEGADAAPEQGFTGLPLPMLLAIMALFFYFLILRPQQKKDKQFRSMLESLKEKDRIVTTGGMHGVITNVQRDRDEITIRVDESTGTKIRVNASSISRVVTDEDKTEKK